MIQSAVSVVFQFVKIYTDFSFFSPFSNRKQNRYSNQFSANLLYKIFSGWTIRVYWKLREEALDRTLLRIRFGRDCAERQTVECMKLNVETALLYNNLTFEAITNLIHKYLYSFNITILYRFRASLCSSSGGLIV